MKYACVRTLNNGKFLEIEYFLSLDVLPTNICSININIYIIFHDFHVLFNYYIYYVFRISFPPILHSKALILYVLNQSVLCMLVFLTLHTNVVFSIYSSIVTGFKMAQRVVRFFHYILQNKYLFLFCRKLILIILIM